MHVVEVDERLEAGLRDVLAPFSNAELLIGDARRAFGRIEILVNNAGGGGVQPYALDPKRAQALWQKSEQLVGEPFGAN